MAATSPQPTTNEEAEPVAEDAPPDSGVRISQSFQAVDSADLVPDDDEDEGEDQADKDRPRPPPLRALSYSVYTVTALELAAAQKPKEPESLPELPLESPLLERVRVLPWRRIGRYGGALAAGFVALLLTVVLIADATDDRKPVRPPSSTIDMHAIVAAAAAAPPVTAPPPSALPPATRPATTAEDAVVGPAPAPPVKRPMIKSKTVRSKARPPEERFLP